MRARGRAPPADAPTAVGDRSPTPTAQDMHVHSTFSDGSEHDRGEHRRGRARSGCGELTCVDHVRESTPTSCPDYVAAVAAAAADAPTSSCSAGSRRSCSTPPGASTCRPRSRAGVDRIYAADHQVPSADGPHHPRESRRELEAGELDAARRCSTAIVDATVGRRRAPRRTWSSPTCSASCRRSASSEDDVPHEQLERLADGAARRRRPDRGLRALELPVGPHACAPFVDRGVELLLSTDSHMPETIGPLRALRGDAAPSSASTRAEPRRRRAPDVRDALRVDPRGHGLRGRDPAARRLLPVRARRPAPLPPRQRRRARLLARTSRSIIPAWNEGAVIGRTIDRLVGLEYPRGPPADLRRRRRRAPTTRRRSSPRRRAEYPGLVFHLRREKGGEGKAHTINHGLREIVAEGWYEAVLIIDADVILTPPALRQMTRHLADPEVGAVTAYIKEGSRPATLPEPLRRLRVHHRPGRRPARPERARRPGLPGRRLAADPARERSRRSAARSTPRRWPRTP